MRLETVTVRVPGSTSNLGPGFDTLGLAVELYNYVQVTRVPGRGFRVISHKTETGESKASALVGPAIDLLFQRLGSQPFGVEVELKGEVPIGRGLGASATARTGVLAALNELAHANLKREELLEMVTALEGHPDNASPAIFGGFTVSSRIGGSVRCLRFPVSPKLRFITLIPCFEISTVESRKLVPGSFSRADTAHNLNRAALITAAFASGNYEALRGLFEDRVHQPYRERLIPQLSAVIRAGEKTGAIGGWLSGSGSAIMCMTLENSETVAKAMQEQFPEAQMKVLAADNQGLEILR